MNKAFDDKLAYEAFSSYRSGLCQMSGGVASGEKRPEPKFSQMLNEMIKVSLPEDDLEVVESIFELASKILSLARASDLNGASLVLDAFERRRMASRQFLTTNARLFLRSVFGAAEAYFHYRCNRLEDAHKLLLDSMDADLSLECDLGYDLMQVHRIQTGCNLMRLFLRTGKVEEALSLAGKFIAYIEGDKCKKLMGKYWNRTSLDFASPDLLARMEVEVITTLAFACVDMRGKFDILLKEAVADDCFGEDRHFLDRNVRLWIDIRKAYREGDLHSYFCSLGALFRAGPARIATVWYACVAEFYILCRDCNSNLGGQLAQAILKDSAKWRNLSPGLKFSLLSVGLNGGKN